MGVSGWRSTPITSDADRRAAGTPPTTCWRSVSDVMSRFTGTLRKPAGVGIYYGQATRLDTVNFAWVVQAAKREAKGMASPEEVAWLSTPENVGTWASALQTAIDDIGQQFAHARSRLDGLRADTESGVVSAAVYETAVVEHDVWSKKASRYQLGLQERLAAICAIRDDEITRLRAAIVAHRDAQQVASDADRTLWSLIA